MHMIFFLYVCSIINKTGLISYFLFFKFRLYLNKPFYDIFVSLKWLQEISEFDHGFDHLDIVGVVVQLSNRSFCLFVCFLSLGHFQWCLCKSTDGPCLDFSSGMNKITTFLEPYYTE